MFSFFITFVAVCIIYAINGLGLLEDEDENYTEQSMSYVGSGIKNRSFNTSRNYTPTRQNESIRIARRVSPKMKKVFSPLLRIEDDANYSDRT